MTRQILLIAALGSFLSGAAWAQPAALPATPSILIDTQPITSRIATRLPADFVRYFDLVLYVNKATDGAWAQTMFVFRRDANGGLGFVESFPVSTGRERREQYFTHTPEGIFEIDSERMFTMAHSGKWHGAPMPHAMFLDYSYRTVKSGVALHAAVGKAVDRLGNRDSGGCIRMPPDKAAALFDQLQNGYVGQVPTLVFDEDAGTTNRRGLMVKDRTGNAVLKPGRKVVVVVDAEPGPLMPTLEGNPL